MWLEPACLVHIMVNVYLLFPAGGSSAGASGSGSSPKPVASIAIKRKGDGGEKENEAKKVKEGGDSLKA